jgi:N-acetylmuramoyl-L-alanine amidase
LDTTEHLDSTRVRRHRRTQLISASLLLVLISIRGAVAFVQNTSLPPMPLAYAYVPSPNCDDRLPGTEISCIVLHATVEPTTEGTEQIFLNRSKKVSAHFVVGKDGRVIQMVPIEKRAWHAGKSVLEGQTEVNNFSIGIEMVNLNDGKDPYPREQVEAVAGLIRFIRSRYPIPDSRIVSHAAVAQPVGRKSDPAGFDFDALEKLAAAPQQLPGTSPARPIPADQDVPSSGRKEHEE